MRRLISNFAFSSRLGRISSVFIDRERSNAINKSTPFCSISRTSVPSFGPARPTVSSPKAKSKRPNLNRLRDAENPGRTVDCKRGSKSPSNTRFEERIFQRYKPIKIGKSRSKYSASGFSQIMVQFF